MNYERELTAALEAAAKAAAVIVDHYARFEAISDAPASISTAADRESQEVILRYLRTVFPDDAVRAEEQTPALAEVPCAGERLWVVDPIDGTRGFARKTGEFSVMIAFVLGGSPVVGVVLEPQGERCTYASRGSGSWRRDGGSPPSQVRVTGTASLADATLTQSHTNPAKGPTRPVRLLRPGTVVETYSAGIKLAQVARGEADLYVSTYDLMNDWDLAAGHVLVEEAGGRMTDLSGQQIHYGDDSPAHAGGLLASNGTLHEAALAALRD
jgi:3'-phosphoadenosine 5'-phosphosulfate (PAPS) 3'-phosphatase